MEDARALGGLEKVAPAEGAQKGDLEQRTRQSARERSFEAHPATRRAMELLERARSLGVIEGAAQSHDAAPTRPAADVSSTEGESDAEDDASGGCTTRNLTAELQHARSLRRADDLAERLRAAERDLESAREAKAAEAARADRAERAMRTELHALREEAAAAMAAMQQKAAAREDHAAAVKREAAAAVAAAEAAAAAARQKAVQAQADAQAAAQPVAAADAHADGVEEDAQAELRAARSLAASLTSTMRAAREVVGPAARDEALARRRSAAEGRALEQLAFRLVGVLRDEAVRREAPEPPAGPPAEPQAGAGPAEMVASPRSEAMASPRSDGSPRDGKSRSLFSRMRLPRLSGRSPRRGRDSETGSERDSTRDSKRDSERASEPEAEVATGTATEASAEIVAEAAADLVAETEADTVAETAAELAVGIAAEIVADSAVATAVTTAVEAAAAAGDPRERRAAVGLQAAARGHGTRARHRAVAEAAAAGMPVGVESVGSGKVDVGVLRGMAAAVRRREAEQDAALGAVRARMLRAQTEAAEAAAAASSTEAALRRDLAEMRRELAALEQAHALSPAHSPAAAAPAAHEAPADTLSTWRALNAERKGRAPPAEPPGARAPWHDADAVSYAWEQYFVHGTDALLCAAVNAQRAAGAASERRAGAPGHPHATP